MSMFTMRERVKKLHKHTPSILPPKPKSLNKLPYVVPAVIGAAPFLFKYIDPFSFGSASLFFNKEQ